MPNHHFNNYKMLHKKKKKNPQLLKQNESIFSFIFLQSKHKSKIWEHPNSPSIHTSLDFTNS